MAGHKPSRHQGHPAAASAYDLQTGEVYWDDWQKAMMAFSSVGGWYAVSQRQLLLKDAADGFTWQTGDQQNAVYTVTTGRTLNLDTNIALIAPGTTVRVAWHPTAPATGNITVNCGQTTAVTVAPNTGRTFVFYLDGTTGRWLAC